MRQRSAWARVRCALIDAARSPSQVTPRSAPTRASQGAVLNFVVMDSRGRAVPHKDFEKLAAKEGFHLRTGAECNPGACYAALGLRCGGPGALALFLAQLCVSCHSGGLAGFTKQAAPDPVPLCHTNEPGWPVRCVQGRGGDGARGADGGVQG